MCGATIAARSPATSGSASSGSPITGSTPWRPGRCLEFRRVECSLRILLLFLGGFLAKVRLELTAVDVAVAIGVDLGEACRPRSALQLVRGEAAVSVLVQGVEIGAGSAGTEWAAFLIARRHQLAEHRQHGGHLVTV